MAPLVFCFVAGFEVEEEGNFFGVWQGGYRLVGVDCPKKDTG